MSELGLPKLLFCAFAEVPGPSAVGARMRQFLEALGEEVEVDALTLKSENLAHIQRVGLARMMRVPVGDKVFLEKLSTYQRALKRQITSERYDLVFCADVFSAEVAAEFKEQQGYKLLAEFGVFPATAFASLYPVDKTDNELRESWEEVEDDVFDALDLVIAPSRYAARLMSNRIDARKVQLLPRLVERHFFHPPERKADTDDPRKLVVVFERRASARRTAVLRVLQALNECTTRRQVRLALLGQEPDKDRMPQDLDKLFLQRVELMAGNSREEIAAVLQQADVVVVPSSAEESVDGFALPHRALEAMSCQAAVVVTGGEGPFRGSLQNGHEGVVVAEHAPDEAATAVVKLLESPKWRITVAEDAAVRVAETASRRGLIAQFVDLIAGQLGTALEPRQLEIDGEFVIDPPTLERTGDRTQRPITKETRKDPRFKDPTLLPAPIPVGSSAPGDDDDAGEGPADGDFGEPSLGDFAEPSLSDFAEPTFSVHTAEVKAEPAPQPEPDSIIFAANDFASPNAGTADTMMPPIQEPASPNEPPSTTTHDDLPPPPVASAEADALFESGEGAFAESTAAAPRLVDSVSAPSKESLLDDNASLSGAASLPVRRGKPKELLKPGTPVSADAKTRVAMVVDPSAPTAPNPRAPGPDAPASKGIEAKVSPVLSPLGPGDDTERLPPAFGDTPLTVQENPGDIPTQTATGAVPISPVRKVDPSTDSGAHLKAAIPAFSKALQIDISARNEKAPGGANDFRGGSDGGFESGGHADTQINPVAPSGERPPGVLTTEDPSKGQLPPNFAMGTSELSLSDLQEQSRDPWTHDTVADARPLFDSSPEEVDLSLRLGADGFLPSPTVRVETATPASTGSDAPASKAGGPMDHTTEDVAGVHPSSEG